jgi:SH3-like domain-containing protein
MMQRAVLSFFASLSRPAILAFAGAGCLTMATAAASPQASPPAKTQGEISTIRLDTPSGLPVPRFVSLKAEKTFCRAGPTFAHPVRIVYQRRGLPVMVVAETRDHWRKIRDAEGDECWIHRAKLSGAPTALVIEDGLALRERPRDDAVQKARLGRGRVARVESSERGWVKVSADGVKGWAPQNGLWGATER